MLPGMTEAPDSDYDYYTPDETMRTVFRVIDPVFGFARFDGTGWVDAWDMYRRVLNGDMDLITPEQAQGIVERLTRDPNVLGPPVQLTREESAQRVALVQAIRRNVASIPIPPGAQSIGKELPESEEPQA